MGTKRIAKSLASCGVALGILLTGTGVAQAAPAVNPAAAESISQVNSERELAKSLETLFEDVLIVDDRGNFVSYNEKAAVDLLGAEEASKLTAQIAEVQKQGQSRTAHVGGVPLAKAAAGQDFVNCMVQNSVLGLISGAISGAYAELIREKQWYELAEKIMPKLVKAGFAGGVVGLVGSLGASAVQCAFFD
ncbi:hypothetical protein [Glutamicibacter soli]